MIINNKQLETLENIYEPQQIKRLLDRAKEEFSNETLLYNDQELNEIIKTCLNSCKDLNIEHEDLIYHLLRLNFLDRKFIEHPFVQKIVALVLNNKEASGQARIRFIEKNILYRQVELMNYL